METMLRILLAIKETMQENREYLIDLDSVVGDSDLGLTMGDGFAAAYDAVKDKGETDLGKLLYFAGKAMSTAVPSTMGTLMASGWMAAGKALKGETALDTPLMAKLFGAYEEGVAARGKAKVGEKTFLDGIHPAVVALGSAAEQGESMQAAAIAAAAAAKEGFFKTKGMLAVHGRAATRGEASRDLLDPGAAVAMLLFEAVAKALS